MKVEFSETKIKIMICLKRFVYRNAGFLKNTEAVGYYKTVVVQFNVYIMLKTRFGPWIFVQRSLMKQTWAYVQRGIKNKNKKSKLQLFMGSVGAFE